MQLTQFTDNALRCLMFCALHPKKQQNIDTITEHFQMNRSHVTKVVHHLVQQGYLQSQRGRSGGLQLALDPNHIRIGKVVEACEPHDRILECFCKDNNSCPITAGCRLKKALAKAQTAFFDVLNEYTLADAVANQATLKKQLGLS